MNVTETLSKLSEEHWKFPFEFMKFTSGVSAIMMTLLFSGFDSQVGQNEKIIFLLLALHVFLSLIFYFLRYLLDRKQISSIWNSLANGTISKDDFPSIAPGLPFLLWGAFCILILLQFSAVFLLVCHVWKT
jgi:ABC-type Fe3+-siderophore transport system permease subunit